MIPARDRRIKKRLIPELEADAIEYQRILDDMVQNSGPLIPDPNWLMTEGTSQASESYDRGKALGFAQSDAGFTKVSKMKDLMQGWIGESNRATEADISRYYRFLQPEKLGLRQPCQARQIHRRARSS